MYLGVDIYDQNRGDSNQFKLSRWVDIKPHRLHNKTRRKGRASPTKQAQRVANIYNSPSKK
jgi:hypothetical protein